MIFASNYYFKMKTHATKSIIDIQAIKMNLIRGTGYKIIK